MRVNIRKSVIPKALILIFLLASVSFLQLSYFEVRATVALANAKAREAADLWSETQSLLLEDHYSPATERWRNTEKAIRELAELRILKGLGMLDPEVEEARLDLIELSGAFTRRITDSFPTAGSQPEPGISRLTRTLRHIAGAIADYSDDQSLYFQNLLLYTALLLSTGVFVLVVVEQRNRALLRAEQRARNLSRCLISDYEKSMHAIALDLHDDIAQDLCLLRMESESPRSKELLDGAIGKLRRLSYDIRPGKAASLPLSQGLRSLLEETAANSDWRVHYTETGLKTLRLPYEVRIHLYRTVQEALANIGRHAAAASVSMKAVSSYPILKLILSDDGRGFDPETVHEGEASGMGLRGMRERIEIIGGRLTVRSRPGDGTQIQIELNIKEYLHGTD